eukprot:m.144789 g.144789  ORF g.144789 m.144789 type:complete len:258 (+) comp52667_c1_seq4:134-907(+)
MASKADDTVAPSAAGLLQNTHMEKSKIKGVVDNYVDFFDKTKGGSEELRKENYETVVNSYYDLATDFYEYGWGQSFHFATQRVGEPYQQALARHEHYLALKLHLNKGHVVLDTGCGVGGPAREIASFSGAKVIGLNNNAYQVQRANKHTTTQKLTHLVSFVKGNFMAIPYEPNTFDAVYAIEATCHAPVCFRFVSWRRVLFVICWYCIASPIPGEGRHLLSDLQGAQAWRLVCSLRMVHDRQVRPHRCSPSRDQVGH